MATGMAQARPLVGTIGDVLELISGSFDVVDLAGISA